ncbi:MAG: hypothetical protein EB144_00615 [Actinobacteria bacterium]|nr:hypothetical protein [Actinomycetota bacterium]
MSVRHFLDVTDLTARDLNAVLTLAQAEISKLGRPLADKGVALIFEKACALEGMHVRMGCPKGYGADDNELNRISKLGAASVEQHSSAQIAAIGAHAVHTDVFVSMGQEAETAKRMIDFSNFRVDASVMAVADSGAIFMHCLPAHREVEVTAEVIDGSQSRVVSQAHNRMHAARGVLAHLMGVTI